MVRENTGAERPSRRFAVAVLTAVGALIVVVVRGRITGCTGRAGGRDAATFIGAVASSRRCVKAGAVVGSDAGPRVDAGTSAVVAAIGRARAVAVGDGVGGVAAEVVAVVVAGSSPSPIRRMRETANANAPATSRIQNELDAGCSAKVASWYVIVAAP